MRKQPEVREKTRQSLINTFCQLYCQKPIEKITVHEITRQAGYNRSTFYQYFTDVYNLLDLIEEDILNYIRRKSKDKKDTSVDPEDILLLFEEKELQLNALLGDYGSLRFIEKLKKEFLSGEETICVPKDSLLTSYLLEFHISTAFSLLRLWHHRGKDLPPARLLNLIEDLFTSGISSVI